MERIKFKKFLEIEHYIQCSICGNFRNINSFAHRKSSDHQKKLAFKLHKVVYHILEAKKKTAVIHDIHWPEKSSKCFCHFCGNEHLKHHEEDEFIVETLGSLYHYSSAEHCQSVKSFLEQNFRKEKPNKYILEKKDLDIFLEKVSNEKKKYIKKMDIINKLMIKQIRDVGENRKELVEKQFLDPVSSNGNLFENTKNTEGKVKLLTSMNQDLSKVPPWLDSSSQTLEDGAKVVIGPTMSTLIKHVTSQNKKSLPAHQVLKKYKLQSQNSSNWLPSFQGVWNKSRRKRFKF